MKKLTSLAIVLALVIFTGCSNRSSSEDVKTSSNREISSQADSQAETTAVTTTTVADTTTTEETTTTTAETTTTTTTAAPVQLDPKLAELKSKELNISVKNIQMLPELPGGSEVTCATMVLRHAGCSVDKVDFARNYLPTMKTPDENGIWGAPWETYIGDPEGEEHYGCDSIVLQRAINQFFETNYITICAVDNKTDSSFTDLYFELEEGNPVIIWVTKDMEDIKTTPIKVQGASDFDWPQNQNCVVLTGYNLENDTVTVSDPSNPSGNVEYPRNVVENVFNQLGRQALVIHFVI